MRIIIATIKSWNIIKAEDYAKKNKDKHIINVITSNSELNSECLKEFKPDYIFFPHWSYIIPPEIFEAYNCVVFHMTDLPYGRGGSPLQNLIVRGHKETMISAIKVVKGLDAGPVYCKEKLGLEGSATEIFERAADIIFQKMIPKILSENIIPKEQEGIPVVFKRRKPEESELESSFSLSKIYDYIRMLDAEGYPHAFLQWGKYKLEFDDAEQEDDKIVARVIIKENEV